MIRAISLIVFLALVSHPFATAFAGNFNLNVNGTDVEIDVGQEQTLKLPDGKELVLKLERKAENVFKAKTVSFAYPSQYNVASQDLGSGAVQHIIVTALGTVILVQTYADLDATTLVDLMTGKMTDDDVAAGSERITKPQSRTLADGAVLKGTLSSLKRVNDDVEVEILAAKQGRGGVMLITRIDHITAPDEDKMIARFWESLKLEQ